MQRRTLIFALLIAMFLFLAACRDEAPAPTTTSAGNEEATQLPAPEVGPPPTVTAIPPTPTPQEPLAATVNGANITLADYEEALARHQQGQTLILPNEDAAPNEESLVLDMLIERALIEQAAQANGIEITPQMVDEQMAELRQVAEENNGAGSFESWLEANQWTEEAFRAALAYEMLTEQVSARITAEVPVAVPQVRARYIQVDDSALAQSLLEQVDAGSDFATLAREHSLDHATAADGGDLGYFSEGTLLVPELEQAAFALQVGEVSDVITATSADGAQTVYYLLQVVEVDPERPLGPDQRAALLQAHFESWLAEQWSQAVIERFIETGA